MSRMTHYDNTAGSFKCIDTMVRLASPRAGALSDFRLSNIIDSARKMERNLREQMPPALLPTHLVGGLGPVFSPGTAMSPLAGIWFSFAQSLAPLEAEALRRCHLQDVRFKEERLSRLKKDERLKVILKEHGFSQ